MAGSELTLLKEEINHYLGIPYFSNTSHLKSPQSYQVGKGTWSEIKPHLSEPNIGIDCSGLVYHLLDFYAQKKYGFSLYPRVIGTENQLGPRRVSANLFTSAPNSVPVTGDIQTGDLIRFNGGKHVMFIIEKIGNVIHYVHSSEKTKVSGVHLGTVTTDFKNWSDVTSDNQNYGQFFHPSIGDGIYRLKCFQSI